MPDREQLIEIVVAVTAVLLMLATLLFVGAQYSTDGGLSEEGGWVLVGVIAGFVLLWTVIGIGLAYRTDEEDDDETDSLQAA